MAKSRTCHTQALVLHRHSQVVEFEQESTTDSCVCVTTEARPLDRLGQHGEFEQGRNVCVCAAEEDVAEEPPTPGSYGGGATPGAVDDGDEGDEGNEGNEGDEGNEGAADAPAAGPLPPVPLAPPPPPVVDAPDTTTPETPFQDEPDPVPMADPPQMDPGAVAAIGCANCCVML